MPDEPFATAASDDGNTELEIDYTTSGPDVTLGLKIALSVLIGMVVCMVIFAVLNGG